MQPVAIRVFDKGSLMRLTWADGTSDEIAAEKLRSRVRNASSERARIDGVTEEISGEITILDVVPIGQYAVNIVFSDGHDRGIFPWNHLQQIATESRSGTLGN
jgi:DUF971 family protein